ncbi:MAG: CsgG/HfaB family protein [Acidobacteriaceae bacterium]|jgi:tetratricopeptide (TPR) repeat protein
MRKRACARGLLALVVCIAVTSSTFLYADAFGDAKKAYQNGQNDQALTLVLVKLRKDNSHQDAIALFKTVLKLVIDQHQAAAQDDEAAGNYEAAIREYQYLRQVGTEISSVTPMEEVKINGKKVKQPLEMPKIDVREQLQKANNAGTEAHYQKGVSLASAPGGSAAAAAEFSAALRMVPDYKDTRQLAAEAFYRDAVSLARTVGNSQRAATAFDGAMGFVPNFKDSSQLAAECLYRDGVAANTAKDYKSAVGLFRRSASYVPGFKDAEALAEKAKVSATRRIAVMPFTNLSGKQQFGEVGQILTDQIISGAMGSNPEFMEFVTRDYVQQILQEQSLGSSGAINESSAAKIGKLAGINSFVFGKVLSITVFQPPEQAENGTNTVVACTAVTLFGICPQGSSIPITANYTKHTLQGYVEITGSFQIIDVEKGTIVKSASITKRMEDHAQWVTYEGDQRAIPSAVMQGDTGQKALNPPEQLAQTAIQQIGNELAGNLVGYFQ